jgi:hypothetical protein
LKYPGIEAYLVSIKRSGFSGRKVMLCWGIQAITRQKLIEYGFELIDIPQPTEPFFIARMRVCWEYLRDHHAEFRFVFWLDVKDLVLQSDPSLWLEQSIVDSDIIASTECVTIEQEETNQLWARSILGEDKYQEIKDCEVINGGAWAGRAEAMKEVFRQVSEGCSTYTGGYPPCQIWINYVMHVTMKAQVRIPRWSEGFAACLHPCWSPWRVPCWPNMRDLHPTLKLDTCVLHAGSKDDQIVKRLKFNNESNYNLPWEISKSIEFIECASSPLEGVGCSLEPKGKPFVIVHGYDRDWGAKDFFEFKYRFEGDFSLDEFNVYYKDLLEHRKSTMPIQRRGLRRPARESFVSNNQLPQQGRVFKRHT